jgi:hypothetical protein
MRRKRRERETPPSISEALRALWMSRMSGSVVMFDDVLDAMLRFGCRFVVIGSVARALTGGQVVAHDLDVMIDASADGRRRLGRALADLGATVETRDGWRRIAQCTVLPWDWGFRVSTAAGQVDVITQLIDGTTIDDHDAHATAVRLYTGCSVQAHPTQHLDAA